MRTIFITMIISLISTLGCNEESIQLTDTYYGKWELINVSGGFTGKGHDLNFDYLIIEQDNYYQFVKNDTIIEYGRIVIKEENEKKPLISFVPDNESKVFMGDAEKYLVLEGKDTLNLNSPCCDRFNYHFVRE